MSVNILNELRRDAYIVPDPALEEIEDYLADTVAKTTVDVLSWWSGNAKRFPKLSNMARDYLWQQTTSIASERPTYSERYNQASVTTTMNDLNNQNEPPFERQIFDDSSDGLWEDFSEEGEC
ncbi:unnamed protein product [Gordionus sp. m RMFG-2023]